MLHTSIKIGQTLEIDQTKYTLLEVDRFNSGAKIRVTSADGNTDDRWVYVGDESIAVDESAELAMHSIAPDFLTYAKLTLISNRIHDVKFP